MAWPLSQDYNEAIQNPAQCFADPELRQGEAETNELGLPAPRSGNFADVYAVVTGQRKWAVKCFTRQIPGLQERYQQISLHLKEHKPSFMVDFTFLEKGIRVRGDWYPVLKMEWVEGFTLNQFVKSNLHKPQLLDLLSQLWVKLSARLRKANIAHCDLQHGNVLLVPASRARALAIKLVDYDGMCVPALTLLKSIEVGHPAYQHPQRQRECIYNLEVDRFSHLVIYTALRGLEASGKTLWEKYDDGDNLLFKPSDFVAPSKSRLFYELLKSGKVANLAKVLVKAATEPLDKAPLLEELAPEALARSTTVTAGAPAPTSPADDEENVFASQLQGVSAVRRPRVADKKSLKVPLIAVGILLGACLVGVGSYFLFRDNSTTPPDDRLAQTQVGQIDPAPTPKLLPAEGKDKTELKDNKKGSAALPQRQPALPPPPPMHEPSPDNKEPVQGPVVPPPAPTPPPPKAAKIGPNEPPLAPNRQELIQDPETKQIWLSLTFEGELTEKHPFDRQMKNSHHKVYNVPMTAGRPYRVSLKSSDFDAALRLEDPSGLIVAAATASNGTARLAHRAMQTGSYRAIVTSIRPNQTGRFTLIFQREQQAPPLAGSQQPPPSSSAVDLLKLINPEQDSVQGQWTLKGQALVSPAGATARWQDRIRVPYVPPEEYSLQILVERKAGKDCLSVGLIADLRQFLAQFDSWPPNGYRSGLQFIDKKNIINQPAAKRGQVLLLDKPTELWISVRKSGIIVKADNEPIASFTGDYTRLSLESNWAIPDKETLFLGSNASVFRITKMILTPISGAGMPLRLATPTSPSAEPAASANAKGLLPVPGEAAQETALNQIEDMYKEEFKSHKPRDLENLATRLYGQAQKTSDDPALQYVLLREARNKAADAARADLAVQAVDEMARHFAIHPLEDKASALEQTEKTAVSADSIKQLVKTALDLVKEATNVDNYEVASRLLKAAALAAARSGSKTLQASVRTCSDETRGLQKEYDKVKPDMDKLAVDPNEAAANLAVGRYCSFHKKDWDKGLPHLARGSDPVLAELANMELKEASSPESWMKLGEGWRQYAAKADGAAKAQARCKAYAWYVKAYPEVSDKDVARVEKHMTLLAKEVPDHRWWDVLDISQAIPKQDTAQANAKKRYYLHLEPGKTLATRRRFSGPLVIQAAVKTDQYNLMLRASERAFVKLQEENSQHLIHLFWPDPNPEKSVNSRVGLGPRSPFVARGTQVIEWEITETGVQVLINKVIRRSFNARSAFDLSRSGPIMLTSPDVPVDVYALGVSRSR